MKITAKTRYALRILSDIAANSGDAPRTIREIAASQGISEKFISRIVVPLRRSGLLASERGVNGGLRLARFPERISLLDIVTAMDGPLSLVHCLSRPHSCPRQGKCAAETAWRQVNDSLAGALESVKLSSVVADQRSLAQPQEPDYCI